MVDPAQQLHQEQILSDFISFHGLDGNPPQAFINLDSAVKAFLALQDLVNSGQISSPVVLENIREFLRRWRCESPLVEAYNPWIFQMLRKLTIYSILDVPLFIDTYGRKRLMSEYECNSTAIKTNPRYRADVQQWLRGVAPESVDVEPIPIALDTPIVHVTHTLQKNQIVAMNGFIPSDKKNIIAGLWFSPKYQLGDYPPTSPYGNWAFETTLRKLGVSGIRQGEIVSYKQEVNFILYASDTVQLSPILKATENAAKLSQNRLDAYTAVSIFVPSRFLPTPCPPTFGATPLCPPTFGAPPPCPTTLGAPPPCPTTLGAPPPCPTTLGAPSPCPTTLGAPPPCPTTLGAPSPCPTTLGAPSPCPTTLGAPPPCPTTLGAPSPCPTTLGAPPPGPPTFGEFYQAAFGEPYQVLHGPFCVQVKRKVLPFCGDLIPPYPPLVHPQQPGTW